MHPCSDSNCCGGCSAPCGTKCKPPFVYAALDGKLSLPSNGTSYLLFVLRGCVQVTSPHFGQVQVEAKHFAFLFGGYEHAVEGRAYYLLIRTDNTVQICQSIDPAGVHTMIQQHKGNSLEPLATNEAMQRFVDSVIGYLNDGVKCRFLHQSKTTELFLVFRYYYTLEQLVSMFYPLLGSDYFFRSLVLSNYKKAKTVEQLAELCGYGVSNFQRTFKQVLGQTPHKWIREQLADQIRTDLTSTSLPIKAIAAKYNFADQPHLNSYCKKYLGATPRQIREGEK